MRRSQLPCAHWPALGSLPRQHRRPFEHHSTDPLNPTKVEPSLQDCIDEAAKVLPSQVITIGIHPCTLDVTRPFRRTLANSNQARLRERSLQRDTDGGVHSFSQADEQIDNQQRMIRENDLDSGQPHSVLD